jgi:hypothetical protein
MAAGVNCLWGISKREVVAVDTVVFESIARKLTD